MNSLVKSAIAVGVAWVIVLGGVAIISLRSNDKRSYKEIKEDRKQAKDYINNIMDVLEVECNG